MGGDEGTDEQDAGMGLQGIGLATDGQEGLGAPLALRGLGGLERLVAGDGQEAGGVDHRGVVEQHNDLPGSLELPRRPGGAKARCPGEHVVMEGEDGGQAGMEAGIALGLVAGGQGDGGQLAVQTTGPRLTG